MKQRKPAATRPRSQRRERGVTSVAHDVGRTPKLPHERDESTDDMAGEPSQRIQQAHEDIRRGLKDTDRGPVMDETYRKLKK